MNTTSKVLIALVAVVAVAGAGFYLSTSSGPVADTGTTPFQQGEWTDQGTDAGSPSAPASQSSRLAVIDDITAALDSDIQAQSSEMSALDQSVNQTVASVDTANSSKQPYDENSI